MEPLHLALRVTVALTALAAGIFDLRYRRIPNLIAVSGMAAGFVLHAGLFGLGGLTAAALGFLVALAIYLPLYLLRAVGGGDVKLMAAIGAAAGPGNWLVIFVLASLLGGVVALFIVIANRRTARTLANVWAIIRELLRLSPPYRNRPELDVTNPAAVRLPHGAVIAAAVAIYLLGTA